MFYYKHLNKYLISFNDYNMYRKISSEEIQYYGDVIYFLYSADPHKSRRSFSISDPSLLYNQEEGLNLLQLDIHNTSYDELPNWLLEKIVDRKVMAINTAFPTWEDLLLSTPPKKWRINIAGLGDVGSTLLIGLHLLGRDAIDSIGVFDRNADKKKRWCYEMNQVYFSTSLSFPQVHPVDEDNLFDCDMLIFCIAKGVPPVGTSVKDVRMVQFEENAAIIESYGKMARNNGFKGIFAVVSDPVDLLCKALFISSNKDSKGVFDLQGLAPEQIRGYGLGVMHARAAYFAKEDPRTIHYLEEGRAFGPHGEDLIIADSIQNYNETLSQYLTNKAKTANLEIRKIGFKPYIAPALSSGSLSILATIHGDWHYSATYMGGIYMGAKNRLTPSGTEIERLVLPNQLLHRLEETYAKLGEIL